jgi:hypothetical protein
MKDGRNEIAIKRLNLAKRYLENAKEDLNKAGIDKRANRYIDLKYVSKASGTAYLSALEALKALFISKNLVSDEEVKDKFKKVEEFYKGLKNIKGLGKDRDLLLNLFDDVYNILHLGGYYRELQDKKAIDSGFEKVEKIIKIVESYIK